MKSDNPLWQNYVEKRPVAAMMARVESPERRDGPLAEDAVFTVPERSLDDLYAQLAAELEQLREARKPIPIPCMRTRREILQFVTEVPGAMQAGIITGGEARVHLYAAQVALSALPKRRTTRANKGDSRQ